MSEETPAHRLKRLHMRSIRRGIKEMDIILTRFAESELASLDAPSLDTYDLLLSENDQDLYQWVTGQTEAPDQFQALINHIVKVSDPSR